MIKVGVIGATGRMGKEIVSLINQSDSLEYAVGVGSKDTKDTVTIENVDPSSVDVMIDFALLESFSKNMSWCAKNKIPIVSGVTGIATEHEAELKKASKDTAVLWSPNMSLGVAFVNSLIKEFKRIKNFDFQIEELHHSKKLDAPSGTAKLLQKSLKQAVEKDLPEPVAIRGGGIFGVHKIWAMSEEEVITLEHSALNRSVFARGAVTAAEWIVSQKPGQYNINDLIQV
ncbi:MAG: 4-hydroxy-tetrahydrodipicolinate reductase [Bdellovibrionales bacterium]|nr:4-hydroxy-tetrahydrodipicolinate reductase [Bdellovibrionales bacterium]